MNIGVILAAGEGSRVNLDIPKQFIKINGKMVVEYTIENMVKSDIGSILLVVHPKYLEIGENLKEKYKK